MTLPLVFSSHQNTLIICGFAPFAFVGGFGQLSLRNPSRLYGHTHTQGHREKGHWHVELAIHPGAAGSNNKPLWNSSTQISTLRLWSLILFSASPL